MTGLSWLAEVAKWIATIGGAVAMIYQWIVKPLKQRQEKQMSAIQKIQENQQEINKDIKKEIEQTNEKIDKISNNLKSTQDDIADVLGDRLSEAHRHYMEKGWCPESEKRRFIEMHQRYSARGHNHLIDTYESDILCLPEREADVQ